MFCRKRGSYEIVIMLTSTNIQSHISKASPKYTQTKKKRPIFHGTVSFDPAKMLQQK